MQDLNLDFLAGVELVAVEKSAVAATAKHEGPTNGADIRLYKSGKIYPSKEFAAKANLEFLPKGCTKSADGRIAMGMDIIDSTAWVNYPKGLTNLIFVMLTPKSEPRVDLFNTTHYSKEDGITPVSSVFTQGACKGAKSLVSLVKTFYGVFEDETTKFVDLKVVENRAMKVPTGIYQIPKIIAKGDKAGELTYVRRENNLGAFPLVIFSAPKEDNEAEVSASVETVAPVEKVVAAEPVSDTTDVFAEVIPADLVQQPSNSVQTVIEPIAAAPVVQPMAQPAPVQQVSPAPVAPEQELPEDFIFESPVAPVPVFQPNTIPTNEVVNGKPVNGGEVLQAVGANAFEQSL